MELQGLKTMEFEKDSPKCKYHIICDKYNSNCKPKKCKIYELANKQISEKELIKANLDKMYLEDMCDF